MRCPGWVWGEVAAAFHLPASSFPLVLAALGLLSTCLTSITAPVSALAILFRRERLRRSPAALAAEVRGRRSACWSLSCGGRVRCGAGGCGPRPDDLDRARVHGRVARQRYIHRRGNRGELWDSSVTPPCMLALMVLCVRPLHRLQTAPSVQCAPRASSARRSHPRCWLMRGAILGALRLLPFPIPLPRPTGSATLPAGARGRASCLAPSGLALFWICLLDSCVSFSKPALSIPSIPCLCVVP